MRLMLITNLPDIAAYADDAGVDTIFVDLEKLGKEARQGRLDTVKSNHSIADVAAVRAAVRSAEVMVRTNPLHDGSRAEVDNAIAAGADCLMLPMFRSAEEVLRFCDLVDGRARVRPLLETTEALRDHRRLASIKEVDSYHFGLNDLHLAFDDVFIFEPLIDGRLDAALESFRDSGKTFGIGGVARCDEGEVSGRMVLTEGLRRGSSAAILSRTFHRGARTLHELTDRVDLKKDVAALRDVCDACDGFSASEWDAARSDFETAVRRVVVARRATATAS